MPATIGSFVLDRFEVTVGRYRRFIAGYPDNHPRPGDGARKASPDSGWNPLWDNILPPDRDGLMKEIACDLTYETWTPDPGPNEDMPMNCLTWYAAFAFCVWDGGRLPTEAEWSYAAVGGSEQRPFPWKNGPPDASRAVYGCTDPQTCMISPQEVGSKSPAGDGAFGQADLAGNLLEWTLDEFGNLDPNTVCTDCANTSYPNVPPPNDGFRVILGAAWRGGPADLRMDGSTRRNILASFHANDIGVRCARDL